MKIEELKKAVLHCLNKNLVPFIKGSPGIGKSQLIYEIAEHNKMKVIDIRLAQLDPVDMNGFPRVDEHSATFLPLDLFPLETTEIPEGYVGWILFLDELPNASISVQNSAYKLILDRMIGNHKLNDKVFLIAAGNREEDGAFINSMPNPLKSRMIQLNLTPDTHQWLDWAYKNNINFKITSYIQSIGKLFLSSLNEDIDSYPCPRTWEFVNRLIEDKEEFPEHIIECIKGAVGQAEGHSFISYLKLYTQLESLDNILREPEKAILPNELAAQYAMLSVVAKNTNTSNADSIMKYVNRFDLEQQYIYLKEIQGRNASLLVQPDIRELMQKTSQELHAN